MKMRENMMDVYKVLSNDEKLLRLLYYKADYLGDDVTIETTERPNILDMSTVKRWAITDDLIKNVPKTNDLDGEKKCRILYYPSRRHSTGHYYSSAQSIVIDVLVHMDFENDFRLEWLCDHITELLFDKKVTGVGKISFDNGDQLTGAVKDYIGYRLTYSFGSVN